MGQKHQQSTDSTSDSKKKRRVAIAPIDTGVEANECIQIYMVGSKDEAEAGTGYQIDPLDLNHFFDDDGKIYGYQGLKITIWVSSVSFHVYTDITFESSSDRGKGITDLKAALQDMFAENIVEKKDDFFQTFTTEKHYISSVVTKGELLVQNAADGNGHSHADTTDTQVIRFVMGDMSAGLLYSRLVPLVLLLVDGSNPIDVTDSCWEMYVIVQKIADPEGDQSRLLGFAAAYRFYHYPDTLRLRLSQILVLPPYQQKGYGRRLLEILNNAAMSESVYDLTVEEPVDSLQRIRYYIDVPRLLTCSAVQSAVDTAATHLKEANLSKRTQSSQLFPPLTAVNEVRKSLKINKKQFLKCWEILLYIALNPVDKYMENYRIFITDQVKASVIGKDTGTKGKQVIDTPNDFGEDAFVMYKPQDCEDGHVDVDVLDEDQKKQQEQQLLQIVDERVKEIQLVAQKVSTTQA
ncbi:histone acetyltransferase type B catalytic subunit-like [Chenopodium quinoa]|uniref:histone acetyltransferase type B catalytic subunit-like n=1 Tax=Chenopodium quinoa TaxID=63459 RepID=UPI000B78CD77|nr:histone acetyltransferase type B catalytic subunit-like [Chenopodium quinoa]